MAQKEKRQSDLLWTDWTWSSDDDGTWPWETIRTAAVAESARRLISIDQTLRTILQRLDQLGTDGLHEVIRRELTQGRVRERQRRKVAAAKRKRTIAAKAGQR